MTGLGNYLLPFALFGAFYLLLGEQARRRDETRGSLRRDASAVGALLVTVSVGVVVLDAMGAAARVQLLAPFVVGMVVFFAVQRTARQRQPPP